MATVTHYASGPYKGLAISASQQTSGASTEGGIYAVSNVLDFTTKYASSSGGAVVANAINGAFEVLAIGANTHVIGAYITVIEPATATVTADLGIAGGGAELLAAVDVAAAAGTSYANLVTSTGSIAVGGGMYFSAADTIDLQSLIAAPLVGKLRVTALCFSPVA
jgi:hypothetical protein